MLIPRTLKALYVLLKTLKTHVVGNTSFNDQNTVPLISKLTNKHCACNARAHNDYIVELAGSDSGINEITI